MLGTGWAVLANFLQFLDPVYDEFCVTCNQDDGQHLPLCTAPQVTMRPVWPIDGDDAKKLGIATAAYMETMPAKHKVRELLEKHLPLFVFAGTVAEVFGERANFSLDKKRKAHRVKLEAQQNRRSGAGYVRPGAQTHAQSQSAENAAQVPFGYDAPGANETSTVARDWPVNA